MAFSGIERGRWIDLVDGKLVWGTACGLDYCDSAGFYDARRVDSLPSPSGLVKIFAYASECCQYPPELLMEFFLSGAFPPLGISRHMRVLIHAPVSKCPGINCLTGIIEYNGSYWTGTIPGFGSVSLHINFLPDGTPIATVDASGCLNYTGILAGIACGFPFKAGLAIGSNGPCCVCPGSPDTIISLFFAGFCKRRYKGRWVDVDLATGKKVFAVADCCPPCVEAPQVCCEKLSGCTLQMSVEAVLTDCSCVFPILSLEPISPGAANWTARAVSCTEPLTWDFALTCTTDVNNCCVFTFGMSGNKPNCGCFATITLPPLCGTGPFELDFVVDVICTPHPIPPGSIVNCCGPKRFRILITR